MRRRVFLALATVVFILAVALPSQSAAIRVKWDSPTDGPGNDWDHAYHTVTAGLGAAVSGDEVWVARGEYFERVTLKSGVGLYGGFAGNEKQLAQRVLNANETILDGGKAGSVVTAPPGATTTCAINGFTIRNGSAPSGGGIYCHSSSPAITYNKITQNTSTDDPVYTLYAGGGGIYCYASSPVIVNNAIARNTASCGAGIGCFVGSAPVITGNIISDNLVTGGSGSDGGGIACWSSSPLIADNTIVRNTAGGNLGFSGGIGVWGSGGYANPSYDCAPVITRNIIADNEATYYGGGICHGGDAATISSNLIARNKVVTKLGGGGGGGICCSYDSHSSIINNTIVGNIVSDNYHGGGLLLPGDEDSSLRVTNNIIASNSSGIMSYQAGSIVLSNNNVWNNSAYNYHNISPGTGDISVDPQFLAPWTGEYHLRQGSPCIDQGDDSVVLTSWTDADGKARTLGAKPDIGCFEWDNTPYWVRSVRQARLVPEGFSIRLKDAAVTGNFISSFYVEDPDRLAGLKILVASQPPALGMLASAVGQLVVDNGERSLQATATTTAGVTSCPLPFSVTNRSLGGGDFFWHHNGEDCGQQSISGASGLNNIGLLVRAWGKVTHAGESFFYIDDGSGVRDGSGYAGVKVYGSLPEHEGDAVGKVVGVNGISSCEWNGANLVRVLRIRGTADVTFFQ